MTNLEAIIQMSQERVNFEQKRFRTKKEINLREGLEHILHSLTTKGYAVVENFYSENECELLRNEVDRVHTLHKVDGYLWIDPYGADKRVFGAEVDSEGINKFHKDQFLLDVAQNYFGSEMFNSNTLAGKIEAKNDNIGSGQGWHRDQHHFQFKAIVYLSDVSINNGPFQIIEGSHRSGNALRNMVTMGLDSMTTRYTDGQVQKVIDENPDSYKVLTAKAGTLIFADTSALHTGMKIKDGVRYALFNYYMPWYDDLQARRKQFNCLK